MAQAVFAGKLSFSGGLFLGKVIAKTQTTPYLVSIIVPAYRAAFTQLFLGAALFYGGLS